MATVFMKWLETNPQKYDRGIQLLTLGRISRIHEEIVDNFVYEGMRILEIGCGTGSLTLHMAKKGAEVIGIDASAAMLAEAEKKVIQADLGEKVTLQHMDATLIPEHFSHNDFHLIVSSLVFSEMPQAEQRYVLEACEHLIVPGGFLLIADEVLPDGKLSRLVSKVVRFPLALVTWLLTRTTTSALHDFEELLNQTGFHAHRASEYLGGSLVMFRATRETESSANYSQPPFEVEKIFYQRNLRTWLIDLWTLFFRIIPPYPRVTPGLYAVGIPNPRSPVLVTGNFDLTVRRLVKAIDGKTDAWILVCDSAGINVWCAAGGGYFTAEKIIAALKFSHLEDIVEHHALILPQLCANGVDGWRIREQTGWGVHWGPARANDIPAYLNAKRKKSPAMRWVDFPILDRLEMVTVTLGFYSLLILIPVLLFWRDSFWPVTASLVGLSYFYALVHPWLPGRDGMAKSMPLAFISLTGLFFYLALFQSLPIQRIFNWVVGLVALSIFTAAELQGMSPLMRGEQANWGWEAVAAMVLGIIYWLAPLALGWR